MLAKNRSELEELIDAAIESAPACVRERILLPSIDWSRITADRGEDMLARLALAHGQRAPQALRFVQNELAELVDSLPTVRLKVAGFSNTHGLAGYLPKTFAAAGFRAVVAEAHYGQALAELMQPGEAEQD